MPPVALPRRPPAPQQLAVAGPPVLVVSEPHPLLRMHVVLHAAAAMGGLGAEGIGDVALQLTPCAVDHDRICSAVIPLPGVGVADDARVAGKPVPIAYHRQLGRTLPAVVPTGGCRPPSANLWPSLWPCGPWRMAWARGWRRAPPTLLLMAHPANGRHGTAKRPATVAAAAAAAAARRRGEARWLLVGDGRRA